MVTHGYKYCRAHEFPVSGYGVRLNIYLLDQVQHELFWSGLFATHYRSWRRRQDHRTYMFPDGHDSRAVGKRLYQVLFDRNGVSFGADPSQLRMCI